MAAPSALPNRHAKGGGDFTVKKGGVHNTTHSCYTQHHTRMLHTTPHTIYNTTNSTIHIHPTQIALNHGQLTSIAVSPTGDCVALGSQQGELHLISRTTHPQVHLYEQVC